MGWPPWEYTVGELFSDAGYATAAFGKWHVGDAEGRLPTDQGFDEWFGIKNTSDEAGYSSYPLFSRSDAELPKIWEGTAGSPVTPVSDFDLKTRALLDEQIAARTAAFIARNAEAGMPFFTYVCFTQMHPPLIHHPDFTGRSGGGVYSDTLAELDYRTGQVLDALDQAGVSDNTIVVWNSDNPAGRAPYMGGSNGPWRGHFASGFEGSMRAPAIVRWPGKVQAGVVTDEILAAVDWLPRLASMVGESDRGPGDRPIDGVDASAFLLGQGATTGRDHVIYFGSDAQVMSVKWRTMKVVLHYTESTSGPIIKPQWPLVFDLIDDPGEEWDLMDKRLDCIWVLRPVAERLAALQQSAARDPTSSRERSSPATHDAPTTLYRPGAARFHPSGMTRTGARLLRLAGDACRQPPGVTMTVSGETLRSISAPDQLDSRLGELEFVDGVPSPGTSELVYDQLDFVHGLNAYLNGFPGASTWAIRKGFKDAGVGDNEILIFSELMDSQSLFLTANADTVYFLGIIDLSSGPMVVESPPQALAMFDDMWFQWIVDVGLPGPDRGEGGRYLLVPPGYDGPVPDSGYHVGHSRTTRAILLGRSFINENPGQDPAPTVELIKSTLKLYPYSVGGFGTSVATLLEGHVHPDPAPDIPETKFVEGSGMAFNTIPPSDFGFFELLNEQVQDEPAGSNTNIELMGDLAAIGIVKGKSFKPDKRMRAILEDAAAVGNATSRTLVFDARASEGFGFYDDEPTWGIPLWVGGYSWETPPPLVTKEGIEPLPATGARTLNARTSFFYAYTGITPAMCMRLTGIGSQYVVGFKDTEGNALDGAKSYRVKLPPDIPAARFWSLTLYDNQTRSMLQTPQRFPRAGSQAYPTPAASADADGSTTVTLAPERPSDIPEGNWIQTTEGKGFFAILRFYSPLQSYFDKTWRPSEIEPLS